VCWLGCSLFVKWVIQYDWPILVGYMVLYSWGNSTTPLWWNLIEQFFFQNIIECHWNIFFLWNDIEHCWNDIQKHTYIGVRSWDKHQQHMLWHVLVPLLLVYLHMQCFLYYVKHFYCSLFSEGKTVSLPN